MTDEVLYLSPTYGGCFDDKKIWDHESLCFSKKVMLLGDLGFLGLSSESVRTILPYKQKKEKRVRCTAKGLQ